jgi:hypothetical protein
MYCAVRALQVRETKDAAVGAFHLKFPRREEKKRREEEIEEKAHDEIGQRRVVM